MTVTPFSPPTPSIEVSSCATILSVPPPSPDPLAGAMESSSSKNTMHGAIWRAFLNIWRTALSDSPNHLLTISGPFTEMKFDPDSLARALAMSVFPVPGGPYRRIPLPGSMPRRS